MLSGHKQQYLFNFCRICVGNNRKILKTNCDKSFSDIQNTFKILQSETSFAFSSSVSVFPPSVSKRETEGGNTETDEEKAKEVSDCNILNVFWISEKDLSQLVSSIFLLFPTQIRQKLNKYCCLCPDNVHSGGYYGQSVVAVTSHRKCINTIIRLEQMDSHGYAIHSLPANHLMNVAQAS